MLQKDFYQLIKLSPHGDEDGKLISLENGSLPFKIKRVYYIYNTRNKVIRGKHSHKKLQQLIIALAGSCTFKLVSPLGKNHIVMNDPEKALFIGPSVWREMTNFSKDCIILVLASENYNEADYVRNFDEYKKSTRAIYGT